MVTRNDICACETTQPASKRHREYEFVFFNTSTIPKALELNEISVIMSLCGIMTQSEWWSTESRLDERWDVQTQLFGIKK